MKALSATVDVGAGEVRLGIWVVSHFEPKKDWFLTHGREGRGVGWWMVARGYAFLFLGCELKQLKYAFYFIQSALLCTFIFAPALVPSEWLAFHRTFHLQSD